MRVETRGATRSETLLTASRPLGVLDDARIPYALAEGGGRSARGAAASVQWPRTDELGEPALLRLGGIPVFAGVSIRPRGRGWTPETPLLDAEGRERAWTWRSSGGDVFLPFDPDAAILALRSEAYRADGAGLARRVYYRVRPALPRPAQIALRRAFSRLQGRTEFPRWPAETALHDLEAYVLRLLAAAAGEALPSLAPWPHGKRWALVLTHDVETAAGLAALGPVRAAEEARGYRSSWNLVPERYRVTDELVAELKGAGHEVGVHGLRHDGRDLESLATLQERLPRIRGWADRWGAVGFRSPATHRTWEWMPRLGFDYDSSSPDSDPYEPVAGGCCSWLPFFNERLVELPITLPQDHTAFVILRAGERLWTDKADLLRERGGMALLITHPDYMGDGPVLPAYERLLGRYAGDDTAWRALPREVAAWWRRRALSRPERVDGAWTVVGPAEGEARIAFVEPAC